MEENNNNNENELMKKVKQKAKNEAKKALKLAKQVILKWLSPVIVVILLILFTMGLTLAATTFIQKMFGSILSIFSPTQENPNTVIEESNSIVSIGEDGEYILNTNFSEQILEELENKKINNKAMGFLIEDSDTSENNSNNIKQITDMIDKYIQTEMKTMFPKTGLLKNQIDGGIKVQRATIKDGNKEIINLKYKPYDDFYKMGGTDILKYYSIKPDDFKLCIATTSVTIIDGVQQSPVVKIIETDYQALVSSYAVPFNFLISLHAVAQDTNFMKELVKRAVEKEIVLTWIDTVTIETTECKYEGTQTRENTTYKKDKEEYTVPTTYPLPDVPIDTNNVKDFKVPEYYTKQVVTTTGSLEVTKADTLVQTVIKEIGEVSSRSGSSSTEGPNVFFEQYGRVYNKETVDTENGIVHYSKIVSDTIIYETKTTTKVIQSYTTTNKKKEIKVDDFIAFIKEYPKVEDNLKTAPSTLFSLLYQYENTQKLEKIMRYVILMLSGVDYGVKEEDLEEILRENLHSVNGSGGGGIPLYTPILTKENFVQAMNEYGDTSGNSAFNQNFRPYAAEIYDVSVSANINPELVIITAYAEQSFKNPGTNNYWGIAVYSQSDMGESYADIFDGIRAYAELINEYNYGGSHEAGITAIYERRKDSGCNPLGYGLPGTFSGMQSQYSATDSTDHYTGKTEYGNYLLNCVYRGSYSDYTEKCLNGGAEHADTAVFTPWESGEYTAWQVEGKIEMWNQFFGKYGVLPSGNGSGSAYPEQGDGYFQIYTNSHGRTFKEYRMNAGSYEWNSLYLYPDCTIHSHGCAVTTVAILATGYGMDVNPEDVNYAQGHGYGSVGSTLMPHFLPEGVNTTGTAVYMDIDTVRNHLLSGGTAYFYAQGGIFAPGSQHYMAILDISADGSQIYLSDPWEGASNSGWIDINLLYNNGGAAPEFSLIDV